MNATKTFSQKHPNGGTLAGLASPNGLSLTITDTRRFNGKRRSVVGLVFNRGSLGWEVVFNPGENFRTVGVYPTETADAAWELAVA